MNKHELVRVGNYYLIGECFSEYDVPNDSFPWGSTPDAKAVVAAVRGKTLMVAQVSESFNSGWFHLPGLNRSICIHKKYLTHVPIQTFEYQISLTRTEKVTVVARDINEAETKALSMAPGWILSGVTEMKAGKETV